MAIKTERLGKGWAVKKGYSNGEVLVVRGSPMEGFCLRPDDDGTLRIGASDMAIHVPPNVARRLAEILVEQAEVAEKQAEFARGTA